MFRYDLGDDFAFSLRLRRAGVRSHFLPKAIAWHDHALTLADRIEASRRSGEASRYITERHGPVPEWQAIIAQPLADVVASVRRAEERERAVSTPDTRADIMALSILRCAGLPRQRRRPGEFSPAE